jgi:hypothetical protein
MYIVIMEMKMLKRTSGCLPGLMYGLVDLLPHEGTTIS